MRQIKYHFWEEVDSNVYIHYNAFNNQFLLLNREKHDALELNDLSTIEKCMPELYQTLLNSQFIVSDEFDEYEITLYRKKRMLFDTSMYQIMVNTTLDCNLNCWYCYENRVKDSYLTDEVVDAIKKNIEYEYNVTHYSVLKISFFGGEPFLYFKGIQRILDFARDFCGREDLELITDFTTNATLITEEQIDYLKDFRCHFQVPIDGNREMHNRIKKDRLGMMDVYQKTMDALHLIDAKIPNRWVAVRINFDNRILRKIDDIINDIDFLDRRKGFVILKKVWQIPKEKVDTELLHATVQKFFDKKFLLDYYIMPKGDVCFAERCRMTLFNYDGKVFKCSTISSFDDSNALGKLDFTTGRVLWDVNKIAFLVKDMLPDNCAHCEWLPACLGPCNRQLMAHKGEQICTFDAMNMNRKEYLMYAFKFKLLQNELLGISND